MLIDPNQIGDGELTEEEEIYKENILDHFKHPRNTGIIEQYTIRHRELNPLCGDQIELFVCFDEQKTCKDVRFCGKGCAISQAAISMLTDVIKNKSVEELKKITREDIIALLGIPVGIVRMKCALLSLKTLHKGIEQWEKNNGQKTHY